MLAVYSVITILLLVNQQKQSQSLLIPKPGKTAALAFAFITWCAINIFYSIAPADALFNLVRFLTIALFSCALCLLLANNKQLIVPLLKGVCISAIIAAGIGFYQIIPIAGLLIEFPENTYQITGSLSHKNLFSSWLMLLLPLAGYAAFRLAGAWRLISIFTLCILCIVILLVQSRGTWLSILLAADLVMLLVSIALIFNPSSKRTSWIKKNKGMIIGFFALPILAVAMVFLARPDMSENIRKKLKNSINYMGPKTQDNETIRERIFLWKHTIQMIEEAPIYGHGGGAWRILFPKYGLRENRSQHGYIHFQRPHNDWLWIGAEYGVIGLGLWSLFWLSVITMLIRRFWGQEGNHEGIENLFLLFGVLAFLINSIFDFPFERSTHMGIAGITLAIAFSNQRTIPLPTRYNPLLWLAVIIGILLSSLSFLRLRSESLATLTYSHLENNNYSQAIEMSKAASTFIYRIDGVSAPMEYYEGIGWLGKQNHHNAQRAFQIAFNRNPNHLLVLNNLGSTWQFLGEADSAKYYYSKAIAISPRFEEALLNIGAIYFNNQNIDSAYYHLSNIYPDSKSQRYTTAIHALLKVEIRLMKRQFNPTSAKWEKLNRLEQNPEDLFQLYFTAWEEANQFDMPLSRKDFRDLILLEVI